jgi:hypothetical protein
LLDAQNSATVFLTTGYIEAIANLWDSWIDRTARATTADAWLKINGRDHSEFQAPPIILGLGAQSNLTVSEKAPPPATPPTLLFGSYYNFLRKRTPELAR